MKALIVGCVLLAMTHMEVKPAVAQSPKEAFPSSMLGFLSPGMHVGIRHSRNGQASLDAHCVLVIFENDGWKIARDARLLPLEELRKRYPAVESLASKTSEDYQRSLADRIKELPTGKRYSDVELLMTVDQSVLLCTVIHVGDDYALFSFGDADNRRRVVPKHMIKFIHWTMDCRRFRLAATSSTQLIGR